MRPFRLGPVELYPLAIIAGILLDKIITWATTPLLVSSIAATLGHAVSVSDMYSAVAYLWVCLYGAVAAIAGGYVIAHLSRTQRLTNAGIAAVLAILYDTVATWEFLRTLPVPVYVLFAVVTLAAYCAGSYLRTRLTWPRR